MLLVLCYMFLCLFVCFVDGGESLNNLVRSRHHFLTAKGDGVKEVKPLVIF